jgi:uncharacterized membrane protein YhhN
MDMKAKLLEYLPRPTLYPFYGTLLLYFLLYQPFLGYPPVTIGSVFFKVLPIWSLAFFVRSTVKGNFNAVMDDDYKKFIFVGLLTSSLGDMFLVARVNLFIPGILAFAVAHVFYIFALEPSDGGGKSRLKNLYILGAIAIAFTLQEDIDSVIMLPLAMLYLSLIFVMSWRATNAYERSHTFPAFAACVGSVLFIMSDFLIAVDKWKFAVPFAQFFVMITYYSAQFFIALSTDI